MVSEVSVQYSDLLVNALAGIRKLSLSVFSTCLLIYNKLSLSLRILQIRFWFITLYQKTRLRDLQVRDLMEKVVHLDRTLLLYYYHNQFVHNI